MKSIKELEQEMKNLMDLEVVRMKIRHQELMFDVVPKLIGVAILVGLLVWFNYRFKL